MNEPLSPEQVSAAIGRVVTNNNPLSRLAAEKGIEWVLNDAITSLLRALKEHAGWEGNIKVATLEHAQELWNYKKSAPTNGK